MTPAESSPAATMSATVDADGAEPELPASVSPSGAELAPPLSVGPPRVSASSLTCNYLDQGTNANLAESLLLAASHAAVLDTHAKPFSSATDSAHAMFKELCAALFEDAPKDATLVLLQKRIFEFVESKRTWLTRLASDEAQRDRATELRAQLLASGPPWVVEAEALAPALICAWDARRISYCGAGPFAGPEELAQHRAGCNFRPCPCPHGCMEVVSAGRLADHDAACGHKLLPCAQGCAAQVRRRDMSAHCSTNCDCRPVECPFAYLGCAEPCMLGTRAAHLEASAPLHLSLLATATAALGRTVDSQLPIIADTAAQLRSGGGFNKQLVAAAAAAAAATERAAAAERAASNAERELRSAQGELRSTKNELRDARDETRKLRDEFKAFKAAVGKQLELK